jgi:ATP dependent DNA ligase C terminal region
MTDQHIFEEQRIPKAAMYHCPFEILPEARPGRWGQGLTKAKMAKCLWLRPVLVAQFEFVEWTLDFRLRHSRFLALRDNKVSIDVHRLGQTGRPRSGAATSPERATAKRQRIMQRRHSSRCWLHLLHAALRRLAPDMPAFEAPPGRALRDVGPLQWNAVRKTTRRTDSRWQRFSVAHRCLHVQSREVMPPMRSLGEENFLPHDPLGRKRADPVCRRSSFVSADVASAQGLGPGGQPRRSLR